MSKNKHWIKTKDQYAGCDELVAIDKETGEYICTLVSIQRGFPYYHRWAKQVLQQNNYNIYEHNDEWGRLGIIGKQKSNWNIYQDRRKNCV